MSALQKITIVLAVDNEHADELAIVWPTWVRFHPEILQVPLIVYIDFANPELAEQVDNAINHPNVEFVSWASSAGMQREKMLSAFVLHAPLVVETSHWLKIDTDVIATFEGPLVREEWLDGNPAFFAQKWGYTKPPSMLDRLDEWAASNSLLTCRKPPPDRSIVGDKAKHRRVISWFCGINTKWSAEIAAICGYRMPVPSQDTLHWYSAYRRGDFYRTIDVKAAGWRHVGSRGIDKLKAAANEAMQ